MGYKFEIIRHKHNLVKHQQNHHDNHQSLVKLHDQRYHVANVQVHSIDENRHVGIATWPQFLATVMPLTDYWMVVYKSDAGVHAYIGERVKILEVLRHHGFGNHKEPVPHVVVPSLRDSKWRAKVLAVMEELESVNL